VKSAASFVLFALMICSKVLGQIYVMQVFTCRGLWKKIRQQAVLQDFKQFSCRLHWRQTLVVATGKKEHK
jgi:hypothetical protein